MPRDSYLNEAMAEDEQLARHLIDQEPTEEPPVRRWSEYDAQVELLTAIFDRLADIPNAIAAANGGKPRKVPPWPRPVTALEKVRKSRSKAKHRSIVSRVLPNGGDTEAFQRLHGHNPNRQVSARAPAGELPSP